MKTFRSILNISNYNIEKDFSGIGVITVKNSKQHTRKNSLLKENSIINFSLENSFITNNMIASKNLSELTTPGNKIIFDRMIQKNNPVEDAKLKYNLKNFYERGNNLKKNIPLKLVSNKMNIQLDFEKVKEKIKCRTSLNSGNNSNHHSNSVSINRKINGKMNEHQIQESNLNTESKNVSLNKIKVDDINYQTKTNSNSKLYSKSIGHTRKNSNIKDELLIEQFNSNIGSRILSLDSSDSLIESDVNKLQKNKLSQIREIIYEILSTSSNIKETFSQDYSSALEILKNYINIQNTNFEIKSKEFNDKIFNLVEQNLILKVKYYFKYNLRMKMKNLTTNSENLIK